MILAFTGPATRELAPAWGALEVLRLDPEPADVHVAHYISRGGDATTSIVRVWEPGDVAHCKRCEACTARDNVCLVVIGAHVPREDCPTFSTVGLRSQPRDGA